MWPGFISRCSGNERAAHRPELQCGAAAMKRRQFLRRALLAVAPLSGSAARDRHSRIQARPRIVIVGGGFAGSACALHLLELEPRLDVALIDPIERYVTCPMSNEVVVGLRAAGSITVTRRGVRDAGVKMLLERVVRCDFTARRVHFEAGGSLHFDRLVLAPGIRFLTDRIAGYDARATQSMPHAWQAGEQTQRLAQLLRALEDGGAAAISVPSGLYRCPPAPYERASLMAHWLKEHRPRSKVLIFDANNRFPRQDLYTAAWHELYPGIIEWIPAGEGGEVTRVDASSMTLYTSSGAHRVALANIIPPQAPSLLAVESALASDHGWCPIDPLTFESTLQRGVYVIGDACIADAMPKAASAACSQAAQCARAIVAVLADREAPTTELSSVCYSLVAPGRVMTFSARYKLEDRHIVAGGTVADPDAQQAEAAQDWYRSIRAEAFAG